MNELWEKPSRTFNRRSVVMGGLAAMVTTFVNPFIMLSKGKEGTLESLGKIERSKEDGFVLFLDYLDILKLYSRPEENEGFLYFKQSLQALEDVKLKIIVLGSSGEMKNDDRHQFPVPFLEAITQYKNTSLVSLDLTESDTKRSKKGGIFSDSYMEYFSRLGGYPNFLREDGTRILLLGEFDLPEKMDMEEFKKLLGIIGYDYVLVPSFMKTEGISFVVERDGSKTIYYNNTLHEGDKQEKQAADFFKKFFPNYEVVKFNFSSESGTELAKEYFLLGDKKVLVNEVTSDEVKKQVAREVDIFLGEKIVLTQQELKKDIPDAKKEALELLLEFLETVDPEKLENPNSFPKGNKYIDDFLSELADRIEPKIAAFTLYLEGINSMQQAGMEVIFIPTRKDYRTNGFSGLPCLSFTNERGEKTAVLPLSDDEVIVGKMFSKAGENDYNSFVNGKLTDPKSPISRISLLIRALRASEYNEFKFTLHPEPVSGIYTYLNPKNICK